MSSVSAEGTIKSGGFRNYAGAVANGGGREHEVGAWGGADGALRGRRVALKLQELGVAAAGGRSCQPTSHRRKSQVSRKQQPSASLQFHTFTPPTMTFPCEESLRCAGPTVSGS